MDFLIYLTPVGNEIISKIISKNYIIKENATICRNKEIFGFLKTPEFIMCTNNIKNTISPVKHYVNETVYHEAVHMVQSCKRGPIGISNVSLNQWKLNDVVRSSNISKQHQVYELEAYYLEDKPDLVLSYIEKYCF
jgi:uncharacterized protein YycO